MSDIKIATFETRDDFASIEKKRGQNMPKWTAANAVYHVYFRLEDSLPTKVREELRTEKERVLNIVDSREFPVTKFEKRRLLELLSEKYDRKLDAGYGACWLKDPRVRDEMIETIKIFEGQKYRLFAWCVMPNHVHIAFQPIGEFTVPSILHSWKSYTAKAANKILGPKGKFWQDDYFSRILRNEDEIRHCIDYIYSNPDKAGLANWPWRDRRDI